ncbi:uncharacterized protein BDZ99DRAFT_566480 [Mytilinidion resinicola]|uniref:Sin3-associated polypeptide Sap18 n=1 Tax=Mytilinidion resinicola TaxID=574789 RepID=A0A6A6Z6F1_9PEZI|nr:uncharacterized protein BDZ99DRAFT_566480 [Mytilinidion resinicola]KAF2816682.1 hypothetical protein BDZ99DRAFT_566480 [Mytilinidion resinicola]
MAAPTPKVDRQTTTPFLLKLFYRSGTFHRLEEFSPNTQSPPHLQIYTWPTCTLKELTHLLLTALPSLLPSPAVGTRLAFRLVFPDTKDANRPGPGRYLAKELGSIIVGAGNATYEDLDAADARNGNENGAKEDVREVLSRLEGDADKSLASVRFVIGDYVSCAVFPPLPGGEVAAAPPPLSAPFRGPPGGGYGGRGGMGPRENGFGGRGDYGGFRGRGGPRFEGRGGVPSGEWRRGEVPQGPPQGFGRGRGRGRGW